MRTHISVILTFLAVAIVQAQQYPLLVVIVVPEARYAAVSGRIAEKLLEQRGMADTPEARAWVMTGWQDYVRKSSPQTVLKVYCDAVRHLEAGAVKLSAERLAQINTHIGEPLCIVRLTRDFDGLMNELGLESRAELDAEIVNP